MSSNVPGVIEWLYEQATNVAAGIDPAVEVFKGGEPPNLPADYICVAFHDQNAGVVAQQATADMAGDMDAEVFDVYGRAVSWRGDPAEMDDCITRAFALADGLEAAVRADPELGGLVYLSVWNGGDVDLPQTDKGPVAAVLFSIHFESSRQ